ncbi:MAG: DNA-3-methyladenine glycosylase I [Actinobacteria bacterium]|nr:DNA-3-methyladenine glycosylase I [Actinomycetota bacterium]
MFEKQPWMHRAGEYPRSDHEYFGLLARAVFSAGLGPKVVESRWTDMEASFHAFQPQEVDKMEESDVSRLLSDPRVIRNRRKIEAVIKNAGRL